MQVEILTPGKMIFKGEADEVFVPGSKGAFEVLKNHAPIISSLLRGIVKVRAAGQPEQSFVISHGIVEVRENQIIILAESVV